MRLAFMKIQLPIHYKQQVLLLWPFHWVPFSLMFSILISPEQYMLTTVMIVEILSLTALSMLYSHFANTSMIKGSLQVIL